MSSSNASGQETRAPGAERQSGIPVRGDLGPGSLRSLFGTVCQPRSAVLHGLEGTLWAVSYVLLGAVLDGKSAMLYSLSAMTSYGHASPQAGALLINHIAPGKRTLVPSA